MSYSDIAAVIVLTIFPFVLFWLVRSLLLKVDHERNGLPWRHVPYTSYLPAFATVFAVGILFFLLIIGLMYLPI